MSSTNVLSKKSNEFPYVVVGCFYTDVKENSLKMPPENAKKMDVERDSIMEISAGNSELRNDGNLYVKGEVVAKFGKQVAKNLQAKKEARNNEKVVSTEAR